MQTTELLALVNQQLDDSFPDAEVIPLFNLCLMELSAIRIAFGHEAFAMLVDRSSEPELESIFRDMLIDFAISKLQFQEEDYDERPDRINRYLQRKQEYRQYLSRQTVSEPIEDVYGVSEVVE